MKHPARVVLAFSFAAIAFVSIGCGSSPTAPSAGGGSGVGGPTMTTGGDVLVDASKDGGVWWFPQAGSYSPTSGHQGKALADAIRARGFGVDELGRGIPVTSTMLSSYRMVIRVGNCTKYSNAELAAYDELVARNVTVILLTDHMAGGCSTTDPLALRYGGITFAGSEKGTITDFAPHAITSRVDSLFFNAGATVVSFDSRKVEILGYLGADRKPVMGVINGFAARIFFLGDVNGIEQVTLPFVDNLINWAFGN
jgi:hypothetical protein